MPMLAMHMASHFLTTITKAFGPGSKQQQRINSLVTETYKKAGIIKNDSGS